MIYYSKIVKIKMDYITKYQYVKLIHFLRRHHKIRVIYASKVFESTISCAYSVILDYLLRVSDSKI